MGQGQTFRNPLHAVPLADPFVLKFNGSYYAYGTPASGPIPVLRSPDLVNWEHGGEAVEAPPSGQCHWAPEVAYQNGHFYLYHSTGGPEGENHQLRVAVAASPLGPFDEQPAVLDPDDPFTIDAHPFRDDDGQWYLFYSRDFLDGQPVGTGIVVDRLLDMSRLAGERATVTRPHAEWQIFERDRHWYDRVWDWFTVEGPFVRKHDGRYWCFYSGGAWRADNYGVTCAVADHPLGPYEPVAAADGAEVLRTAPGTVIGPGHASVVVAPDNVTEYLVYHAWDPSLTGRYMFADRLSWVDGRPASSGPRTDPQPYPPAATFRDLFDGGDRSGLDPARWLTRGSWEVRGGEAVYAGRGAAGHARVTVRAPTKYLMEVNLALRQAPSADALYGALVSHLDEDDYCAVLLDPAHSRVVRRRVRNGAVRDTVLGRLATPFSPAAYHQLLVRRTPEGLEVTLDQVALRSTTDPLPEGGVGLWTNSSSAFAGIALTDLY